jgi:hypothetical protein
MNSFADAARREAVSSYVPPVLLDREPSRVTAAPTNPLLIFRQSRTEPACRKPTVEELHKHLKAAQKEKRDSSKKVED